MPPKKPQVETILLDLVEQVSTLNANSDIIMKEQGRAQLSREKLDDKLDTINGRIASFDAKVDAVIKDVGEMKPTVSDYRELRANINGGFIVVGGIGAIIFTAIGFLAKDLFAWFSSHVNIK